MNMQYSFLRFANSLKFAKRKWWRKDFVDPVSDQSYGWVIALGPITIMKLNGWLGEKVTAVKIFQKEWVW
jgi:hypothetical protein